MSIPIRVGSTRLEPRLRFSPDHPARIFLVGISWRTGIWLATVRSPLHSGFSGTTRTLQPFGTELILTGHLGELAFPPASFSSIHCSWPLRFLSQFWRALHVCPLRLPELSEHQLDCLRRFLRFEFPTEIYPGSGLRSHYFREYPILPNPGFLGPLSPAFHGFRLTAPPAGVVCCCAPSRTYLLDGLNRHLDWVSPGTLHPGPKRPICGGGKRHWHT